MNVIMLSGKVRDIIWQNVNGNNRLYCEIDDFPMIRIHETKQNKIMIGEMISIKGCIKGYYCYKNEFCEHCEYQVAVITDNSFIAEEELLRGNGLWKNYIQIDGYAIKSDFAARHDNQYTVIDGHSKFLIFSNGIQSYKDNIFISENQRIKVDGEYYSDLEVMEETCKYCGHKVSYRNRIHMIYPKQSRIVLDK